MTNKNISLKKHQPFSIANIFFGLDPYIVSLDTGSVDHTCCNLCDSRRDVGTLCEAWFFINNKNERTVYTLPWEATFPSFLGVITHIYIYIHIDEVKNIHFSWFWGPRVPLERGGGRTWTLYHWYVCNVCIIRILDRDYSTSMLPETT